MGWLNFRFKFLTTMEKLVKQNYGSTLKVVRTFQQREPLRLLAHFNRDMVIHHVRYPRLGSMLVRFEWLIALIYLYSTHPPFTGHPGGGHFSEQAALDVPRTRGRQHDQLPRHRDCAGACSNHVRTAC